MRILPALPILLPMAVALALSLMRGHQRRSHGIALGGAALHMAVATLLLATVLKHEVVVLWVGDWPAPFGICLAADYLSAVMVLITAVIHTAVIAYARHDIDPSQVRTGFYPFMQMLTAAVCGAFLTGDLFNLYVWFEVMLMASFGLLVMGRSPGRLTGGVKYVTVNLISTLFFITAIGLIYGMTGTLNMADLHVKAAGVQNTDLLTAVATLLMVAFGIKAALFPLFFWLPAAYHTLPVPVSAFFAGMLSKVGDLCLDPHVYPGLYVQHRDHSLHPAGCRCPDHALRCGGCRIPNGDTSHPLLSYHQSGGVYGFGTGPVYASGANRRHCLFGPPHHRQSQPFPGQRISTASRRVLQP